MTLSPRRKTICCIGCGRDTNATDGICDDCDVGAMSDGSDDEAARLIDYPEDTTSDDRYHGGHDP